MADEYVYKISSRYLQKWLSYDIKHVENNQICPFSLFLFFDRFWFFKKCFWVIFRVLCEKFAEKHVLQSHITIFLGGWPFLPDDLRWPWPVLCSSWMLKTAWDGHREPTYQISTHSYNGAELNRNLYTSSLRAYTINQCAAVLRLRFF